MKIALFEYITGGGLRDSDLPASLAREGDLIIQALVADLADVPNVQLIVLRDDRLPPLPRSKSLPVGSSLGCRVAWDQALDACDAAWPIAPETGGLLEDLCAGIERNGKKLLNSASSAVRVAASKMTTIETLRLRGVPVVATYRVSEAPSDLPFPRIYKPDDGVGCEGVCLYRNKQIWNTRSPPDNGLIQPFLEGESLSLSALFTQGRSRLLCCNRQQIEVSGDGLHLSGCEVNAIPDHKGRWQALADRVAEAIPGLWGYAGIDLIVTAEGPRILEVNPRLTTSYSGIRQATGENPAALILDLLNTGRLPEPRPPGGRSFTVTLEQAHHEH